MATPDDHRASLTGKSDIGNANLFGDGDIMLPLRAGQRNKLTFPYTPTIQMGGSAEYEEYTFTHSIYKYNAYSKSAVSDIVLTADFTAQTDEEAKYMLAALHFMRSNTKAEFGVKAGPKAGTPPPVMLFNYLGAYQYKDVPVVIKDFNYTLLPDVDYVVVLVDGKESKVPTMLNLTITLSPYYNPKLLRKEFSLDDFKNGSLLNTGEGFI